MPEQIHREVLERLADRGALILASCRRGTPTALGTLRRNFIEGLLPWLERITFTFFQVRVGAFDYPVFPIGGVVAGGFGVQKKLTLEEEEGLLVEGCLYWEPPLSEETAAAARPVIRRVQRRVLDSLWTPLARGLERLDEYETMLGNLQAMRGPGIPFRRTLAGLIKRGSTVTLAGRTYRVPPDWENKVSSTVPPAEVAHLLLATAWRCDMQEVKERVARMRKERKISVAWATYGQWLASHSEHAVELLDVMGAVFGSGPMSPVRQTPSEIAQKVRTSK